MNYIVKFLPEGGMGTPTPDFSETGYRAVNHSISQNVLTDKQPIAYFNPFRFYSPALGA